MPMTVTKPGRGKPQTEAQRLAVLEMEREVVQRHAIAGQSFYRIEKDLGISDAGRVYKRAMSVRPGVEREEAAKVQRLRLESLHEKAWQALAVDGLDGLTERIAAMCEREDFDPESIRPVIEQAYSDTLRGIPVALQVSDRAVKLDGLDHAARIADANLELDQAKVTLMAAALVETLRALGLSVEDQRRGVALWGERLELAQSSAET